MRSSFRALLPVCIVFLIFLVLPLALSGLLAGWNIDKNVLVGSNIFLFCITLISFFLQKRGMQNRNPHVFIRSVTGGMLIKMLACIIIVIAYIYYSGPDFNKRAIIISLFLYLVYLFTEVAVVMKMNKKQHA